MKLKITGAIAVSVLLAACQSGKDTKTSDANVIPGSYEDFQRNVQNRAFFAYDSSSVDQQGQQTLAGVAAWSKQYPSTPLIVEGHCDPRGTREYNLGLGERRANSAKKILGTTGATSNINTVSYGKDRLPGGNGTDEATYAANRVAIVNPAN